MHITIVQLDPLDVKILGLLQEDARLSFREIAERLDSTTPTISARVRALEDIGIIRGYRAILDDAVLGAAVYVVRLQVGPTAARGALQAVSTMEGFQTGHLLPGGRVVAIVHLRPPHYRLAQLHEAISRIPGLVSYDADESITGQSRLALEDLPTVVEVACHQCRGPIHGEPVKARFEDRAHVFCCRQCLGTFRDRFETLQKAAARTGRKPPPSRIEG